MYVSGLLYNIDHGPRYNNQGILLTKKGYPSWKKKSKEIKLRIKIRQLYS